MGIQDPREPRRQHDNRRDGRRDSQAADEQNTLRSTFHCRIPISMRALSPGAHHELSGIGHVKRSSLVYRFVSSADSRRARERKRDGESTLSRWCNKYCQ